jgi:hypothetical protein
MIGHDLTKMKRDDWTWASRPTNEIEYDAMMISLDQHLADCGLEPAQRGLNAVRLVSMRLGLSGTAVPHMGAQRTPAFGPTDLLGRVHDWYDVNYATRMNLDMSPGTVVFKMRGTLWRLRLPKVYGSVDMFLARALDNGGIQVGRGRPATHNLLTSVEDLTQALADKLSDDDLRSVSRAWQRGWGGLSWLDAVEGPSMFEQARNDYRHSVNALTPGKAFADTWYASAQCVEKCIKGLLARAGHSFPTSAKEGHNLPLLGKLLIDRMNARLASADLQVIDCPSKVRYGGVSVSSSQALAIHEAALRVLSGLAKTQSLTP